MSSSIPSWQILTAHAQPFRGARDLAFCLKVPLDSLLVWASSEGSGENVRMRRLAWLFAARIGDKYQIRLTRSKWWRHPMRLWFFFLICKFVLKTRMHSHPVRLDFWLDPSSTSRWPAPIAHLVECPLRGTGGQGFDPWPRHTKVVKNGTSCSSLGTQVYGVELGLVDPVSG